jgi:hypothetical protein
VRATERTARLFEGNHPARLWRPLEEVATPSQWAAAIAAAQNVLPAPARRDEVGAILEATLGEAQFGPGHWRLGRTRRLYYRVKPFLPRRLRVAARHVRHRAALRSAALGWPVEDRYAQFVMDVLRALLAMTGREHLDVIHFWPAPSRFAFVLTHDVETAEGQRNVLGIAALETRLGFRSSFNFVPERYRVDHGVVRELQERGFEVCVHDLRHDGRLFASAAAFAAAAQRINRHLAEYGAVGFRAGFTLRNPEWMQALAIEYDMSFFDTDPFEPIAGGTMSLWPFSVGRFLELPYTLAQDNTLLSVLRERGPRLWRAKVDHVAARHGLALVNVHPDYLVEAAGRGVYTDFLEDMACRDDRWHALPRDVARWWRAREAARSVDELPGATTARVTDAGWDAVEIDDAPAVGGIEAAGA